MRGDVVREGETLSSLSARLGVPGCMLLRANRLHSPAWLLPGREIAVPEGDFCRWDGFRCPAESLRCAAGAQRRTAAVARGDTARDIARRYGLTERLVLLAAGSPSGGLPEGIALRLPVAPPGCARVIALPGETAASVARKYGIAESRLRQLNALWGALWPGTQLLIPTE